MTEIGPLFSQLDSTSRPGALTNNSIATDFDRFLNLLTVQLQNQDPLAPMDANQFTQQIVQMTQVEQTVSMNQRLGSLIDAQETQRIQSAVEFVGKEIDAFGSTIPLGPAGADMFYNLAGKASNVDLDIIDATNPNPNSNVISTLEGAPNELGTNRIFWDGTDKNGEPVDLNGSYRLRVRARDINDNQITADVGFSGVAQELRNTNGELMLMVNEQAVPLTSIIATRTRPQTVIPITQ